MPKVWGWTFGSRQAKGLKVLEPCQPPTRVGKEAWSRISKGKHPKADAACNECQVIGLAPWPAEANVENHKDDEDGDSDEFVFFDCDEEAAPTAGNTTVDAGMQSDEEEMSRGASEPGGTAASSSCKPAGQGSSQSSGGSMAAGHECHGSMAAVGAGSVEVGASSGSTPEGVDEAAAPSQLPRPSAELAAWGGSSSFVKHFGLDQ